jgi:hypothetical protein
MEKALHAGFAVASEEAVEGLTLRGWGDVVGRIFTLRKNLTSVQH